METQNLTVISLAVHSTHVFGGKRTVIIFIFYFFPTVSLENDKMTPSNILVKRFHALT